MSACHKVDRVKSRVLRLARAILRRRLASTESSAISEVCMTLRLPSCAAWPKSDASPPTNARQARSMRILAAASTKTPLSTLAKR